MLIAFCSMAYLNLLLAAPLHSFCGLVHISGLRGPQKSMILAGVLKRTSPGAAEPLQGRFFVLSWHFLPLLHTAYRFIDPVRLFDMVETSP